MQTKTFQYLGHLDGFLGQKGRIFGLEIIQKIHNLWQQDIKTWDFHQISSICKTRQCQEEWEASHCHTV